MQDDLEQTPLPAELQPTPAAEPASDIGAIFKEKRENRQEQAADADKRPRRHRRDDAGDEGAQQDRERQRTAPLAALHAEKQRRKAAQERADQLERELEEMRAALAPPEAPEMDNSFWLDPDKTLEARRIEVNTRISKAEYKAEYGKAALAELDALLTQAGQNNHPDMPHLAAAMRASADPVGVAHEWAQSLGWRPGQQQQAAQQQRPAPVFPSNIAGARNVGTRSGPAWGGPTPIGDIFGAKRSIFKR